MHAKQLRSFRSAFCLVSSMFVPAVVVGWVKRRSYACVVGTGSEMLVRRPLAEDRHDRGRPYDAA